MLSSRLTRFSLFSQFFWLSRFSRLSLSAGLVASVFPAVPVVLAVLVLPVVLVVPVELDVPVILAVPDVLVVQELYTLLRTVLCGITSLVDDSLARNCIPCLGQSGEELYTSFTSLARNYIPCLRQSRAELYNLFTTVSRGIIYPVRTGKTKNIPLPAAHPRKGHIRENLPPAPPGHWTFPETCKERGVNQKPHKIPNPSYKHPSPLLQKISFQLIFSPCKPFQVLLLNEITDLNSLAFYILRLAKSLPFHYTKSLKKVHLSDEASLYIP